MHPSHALYQSLQSAYEHFNRELFDNLLPDVIFTVQRQKDVLGYFAPERWVSPDGSRCHEIAINPIHMGQSRVIEVLQTLVHEMAHCWQYCFGMPGRSYYHNKEWAYRMIKVGLQPSSTGEPGGKITGQQMSDYPIEGGRFISASESLVQNKAFRIPWIYRLSLPSGVVIGADNTTDYETMPNKEDSTDAAASPFTNHSDISEVSVQVSPSPETFLHSSYQDVLPAGSFVVQSTNPSRSKSKYRCPSCCVAVWGKPHIHLICGDCRIDFEKIS